MGFVMRLNSRDLVNDPKNGAEVYPITATNAVFREGGESLESILTRLGNNADRKVVQNVTSTNGVITVTFTDGTSETIYQTKSINTNNNTTLTPDSETVYGNGTIDLHKVSKTGDYNDLVNLPAGLGGYPVVSSEYDSNEGINIVTFHKAISDRISVLTLTPTVDSVNQRLLVKCKIVAETFTEEGIVNQDWTEGNVLVKIPTTYMSNTYATYLCIHPSSGPTPVAAQHHFTNLVRTPNEAVGSDLTKYNIYPMQMHINNITRNGITQIEDCLTSLVKCYASDTYMQGDDGSPYIPFTVTGYYIMIPVDIPVPVVNYGGIGKARYLTETEYNNLTFKDPDCLYFIPVAQQ